MSKWTFQELESLAKHVVNSGFYAGTKGGKPENEVSKALCIILYGQELGFDPMVSLANITLINGKPSVMAAMVGAAVLNRGYRYQVVARTDEECVIRFSRGEVVLGESSFTIQDARRAGLTGNGTYQKYPPAMLFARAMTAGARTYCPDVFGGAVYDPEELREALEPAKPEPQALTAQIPGYEWLDALDPEIQARRKTVLGWYGKLPAAKREWVDDRLEGFTLPLDQQKTWTELEFDVINTLKAELKAADLDGEFHQRVTARDDSPPHAEAEAEPPADAYRDFTGTAPERFEDGEDDIPWTDPNVPLSRYKVVKGRATGRTLTDWAAEFKVDGDRISAGPITVAELAALEAMIAAQKRPPQPALIDDNIPALEALNG